MAQKIVDWENIETAYRYSENSVRSIAKEHGINEISIREHAKKNSWIRDPEKQFKIKQAPNIVLDEEQAKRFIKEAKGNAILILSQTMQSMVNDPAIKEKIKIDCSNFKKLVECIAFLEPKNKNEVVEIHNFDMTEEDERLLRKTYGSNE